MVEIGAPAFHGLTSYGVEACVVVCQTHHRGSRATGKSLQINGRPVYDGQFKIAALGGLYLLC